MKEDYNVSYEVGKKLKELGFDEKCQTMLITSMKPQNWVKPERNSEIDNNEEFMIPTVDEAAKWIRDNHKKFIDVFLNHEYENEEENWYGKWGVDIYELETGHCVYASCGDTVFDSYSEAMNYALLYILVGIERELI